MIYNFWTISIIVLLLSATFYCGKREFFDEPGKVIQDDNGERYIEYSNNSKKPLAQVDLGTKYTIEDVNKATKAIIKYFGEKDKGNIEITKIISIKNSPEIMQLNLFLYNPIKNIILGYVIDVNMPMKNKTEAMVKTVLPFSKEELFAEHVNFNSYSSINLYEGNFT
mgnify:CR=1 FL=1